MIYKTIVHHWRYDEGWRDIPHILRKPGGPEREFDEEMKGWHCMVYVGTDHDFEGWMESNMTGEYDCTYRFNSGDPCYFVSIKDDIDATKFKLKWL